MCNLIVQMKGKITAVFVICLAYFSTTAVAQVIDSTEQLDTVNVSVSENTLSYQPSATLVWDIIDTRIALTFNKVAKTASVCEWIMLKPWMYPTDTIELDAKSVLIDSVLLIQKKANMPLSYLHKDNKLKIWLNNVYQNTDTARIYLEYTASPYKNESGGSAAMTDDRGLYFINTDKREPAKPAHIWTQGETEANSHWMITIDKPNTRFTVQLELTVEDSLTTLGNGALIKQTKIPGGLRKDVWRMDKPIQPYAVMFAIGNYKIVKDIWRGKEVSYYVEPPYAPYARDMFRYTTEMMEYFSNRTGVPYPWNKYSQVVVRDYVSGAMENTTASLFGEFINQTSREIEDKNYEDVVSHELFHQWFGDYVTCESWSNTTVNESFANYGEQLWRTYKHGKVSGEELAWNDLQLYIASSSAKDPELVRFFYKNREEMFDAISYNKGGAILRYLNNLIGDQAFDKAMYLYLTQNALKPAEAHHWRLAVEEATGQDWNWFFKQWYYHSGHPILKVHYNHNDSLQQLIVEVTQSQPDSTFLYTLPLSVDVVSGNNVQNTSWIINKKKHTFYFPYSNGLRPTLIPDVNHVLPGEIKENKKPIQWLVQYHHSQSYISRKLAVTAAGKQLSDSASQAIIDAALNDSLYQIRVHSLVQLERTSSDKYKKRWLSSVLAMASGDDSRHVRAAAFDVLAAWKSNTAKATMLRGVDDTSYMVAASALTALEKLDTDTAYHIAHKSIAKNAKGELEKTAWKIIGKEGDDADAEMIEKKIACVWGGAKVTFSYVLNNYIKKVKSDSAFSRVAKEYGNMITREQMRMNRSTIAGTFFQAVAEQTELQKSNDTTVVNVATKRLVMLKEISERIHQQETDRELKDKFAKKIQEYFYRM